MNFKLILNKLFSNGHSKECYNITLTRVDKIVKNK